MRLPFRFLLGGKSCKLGTQQGNRKSNITPVIMKPRANPSLLEKAKSGTIKVLKEVS